MKVEVWDTRFGTSVRVVQRDSGKFVNNKSAKQLIKIATKVHDKSRREAMKNHPSFKG